MRILVVEDDDTTASFITKGLEQEGFVVDRAAEGQEGLLRATTASYDVVVADILMPRLDGLAMIERLRGRRVLTPTIVLSAKGSVDDRVRGLQKGGDDYMVKPFAFSELLARIQALLRRAGAEPEPTCLTLAPGTLPVQGRSIAKSPSTAMFRGRIGLITTALQEEPRTESTLYPCASRTFTRASTMPRRVSASAE